MRERHRKRERASSSFEADKATLEVESPASGILAKILISIGKEVPVLTVVGGGPEEPGEGMFPPDIECRIEGAGVPAVEAVPCPRDPSAFRKYPGNPAARRRLAQGKRALIFCP